MNILLSELSSFLKAAGLPQPEVDAVLAELVAQHHSFPGWSSTQRALIEVTRTVNVATMVTPVFDIDHEPCVLLAEAGEHYYDMYPHLKPEDGPYYMTLGGYINPSHIEGSFFVTACENKPEDVNVGGAREHEEEMTDEHGVPVITVNPARLELFASKVVNVGDNRLCLVVGAMMKYMRHERDRAIAHVERMRANPDLKRRAAEWTRNKTSGLIEVDGTDIFRIRDVIAHKYKLLHNNHIMYEKLLRDYKALRTEPPLPWEPPEDVMGLML